MSSYNQRLHILLQSTNVRINQAQTVKDILDAVVQCVAFGAPLRFDKFWRVVVFVLAAIAAVFLLALLRLDFGGVVFIGAMIAAIFRIVWFAINPQQKVNSLSAWIKTRVVFLLYDVKSLPSDYEERLKKHSAQFTDLQRRQAYGSISQGYSGVYRGARYDLDFIYYSLRLNKKKLREQKYQLPAQDYDYRHYLFVKFPWINGVTLRGDYLGSIDRRYYFETTLADFNQKYKLTGQTEQACAQFAIPSTLLLLMQLAWILKKPNLTFSGDQGLCLSFDDDDLFDRGIKGSLEHPRTLDDGITQYCALSKFGKVMNLLHQLAEQHDDNFASVSASLGDNGALPKSM